VQTTDCLRITIIIKYLLHLSVVSFTGLCRDLERSEVGHTTCSAHAPNTARAQNTCLLSAKRVLPYDCRALCTCARMSTHPFVHILNQAAFTTYCSQMMTMQTPERPPPLTDMAPRKKQGAQKQPAAYEGAPERQQGSTAMFLSLNDDLLGKLYASLEDGKDKASLRHSCAACYR